MTQTSQTTKQATQNPNSSREFIFMWAGLRNQIRSLHVPHHTTPPSSRRSGDDITTTAVLCLQISPDGQCVAFTQDTCGDESFTLVIVHIATQAVLLPPGQVTGIKPALEWSDDSTAVVLVQVGIPLVGADIAIKGCWLQDQREAAAHQETKTGH